MAQTVDAHSSFVYLVDNIPKWKTSIESLSTHAAEKNTEFVAEYTRLINQARPKRKKTPSISSIHTQDEDQEPVDEHVLSPQNEDGLSSPDPRQINPLDTGSKYLYAQARRRKKPGGPSIRSGASGPQKFRNKTHVVVYYDGYLQEQLDTMVKQIGGSRNNLRKGKMALAAARGFRLPTLTTRTGYGLAILDDLRSIEASRSTTALVLGKKPTSPHSTSIGDEEKSFLEVDKELEQIQSLCETAAHQFLRDGDCRTELDSVLQKFDALLVRAAATAETLRNSNIQEENQEATQPDLSGCDSSHRSANSDGTLSTQPSLDPLHTPRIGATKGPSPLGFNHPLDGLKPRGLLSEPVIPTGNNPIILETNTIEVDDSSDQESMVIDLSQYRYTSPRGMRL